MADFVADNLNTVETKTDATVAVPPTTQVITAADINLLASSDVSLRSAITGSNYGQRFNVKRYGALGDGATNDLPALQAATAAAQAAGGGVVYLPRPTVCYRVTGEWIVGSKYIEVADVKYVAGGWNPAAQASYNATADSATQSQAPVSIVAEPGTEIWGDFAPATEKAILWYGIRGNYRASKSARIEGLGFVGQQGYSGGAPADLAMSGELPTTVATNVSGLMLGNARAKVTGCTARAVKRGFVSYNCFWSRVEQCAAYQCVDGFTMIGFNAGTVDGLEVTAAKGYGYVLSGQGINISKINTEGALVDVWVPAADNLAWTSSYLETNDSTATGYSVIWGDASLATVAQVINARCANLHSSRANGKHMSLFATQLTCARSRMFVTNVNSVTTILDTNSSVVLEDSSMPLDAGSAFNANAFVRSATQLLVQNTVGQLNNDYTNPLKLGNTYLWKDPALSTLQFKKYGGAPSSAQDGTQVTPVVESQTLSSLTLAVGATSRQVYSSLAAGKYGDIIVVSTGASTAPAGLLLFGQITGSNQVTVTAWNTTGSTITALASFNIRIAIWSAS